MTDLPDEPCDECGRTIDYSRLHYTIGPMHLSCSKYGEPSEWVLENCELPAPWKPVSDKLEGPDARGWLSPDGDFYQCDYMVHISMGYKLAEYFYGRDRTDEYLERKKWIHISPSGFWIGGGYKNRWDRYVDTCQKQLDALFDWFLTLEPTEKYLTAYMELKMFFQELRRQGED